MTFFLLKLLLISTGALAASPLSLDQALQEARSQNPNHQRLRAVADEAGWHQLAVLSGNLPKLSLSANHFFSEKYQVLTTSIGGAPVSFPMIYPQTQASFDVNWTFFDAGSTPLAVLAARLAKKAADLELEHASLQLENNVRVKFYQALGARLLAEVAEQNVKTLREHLDRSRDLLNRGKATRFDTLRVQVQLEEAEPELLTANDTAIFARQALSETMGSSDDARQVTGALPVPVEPAGLRELNFDIKARADVEALQNRAEATDKGQFSTLAQMLPKVSLGASKQWYNNIDNSLAFGNSQKFRDAYSIGIFLNWNIFDGGLTLARQRELAAQHRQSEALSEAATLKAPHEFEIWRRRLLSSIALYKARTRGIQAAEESVRLARLSYAAGTRTNTDVLDSELDLFRARAGAVRAQLDAAEALANLELALGHKI